MKAQTFSQREGLKELPTQLQLREVSQEFRALAWRRVYQSLLSDVRRGKYSSRIAGSWAEILLTHFVANEHKMADDFSNLLEGNVSSLRRVFEKGQYNELFDFIEYLLTHPRCNEQLKRDLISGFESSHMAYRVLDGVTITPIANEQQADAIGIAIDSANKVGATASTQHLKNSAIELRNENWSNSVRESISAVESIASLITGEKKTLGETLRILEKGGEIHGSLRQAFSRLYGYTSDEEGVRHAMVFNDVPNVDEADAIFMFGACASFVGYLALKKQSVT